MCEEGSAFSVYRGDEVLRACTVVQFSQSTQPLERSGSLEGWITLSADGSRHPLDCPLPRQKALREMEAMRVC